MSPPPTSQKIGLGTVQFGVDYGVANRSGRTTREEAAGILDAAFRSGVRVLDTAPSYGESESVLGDLLVAATPFSIVTKTVTPTAGCTADLASRQISEGLQASLRKLRVPNVYGLLEHRPERLLASGGDRIFDAMVQLRERGLVQRIGVSIYRAEQLDALLDRFAFDLVQAPISVFDQRLIKSGHLRALHQAKIEIHARSVLLQGVAGMNLERLHDELSGLRAPVSRLADLADKEGISAVSAAVAFVCDLPEVDVVLCGVEDRRQLDEVLAGARHQFRKEHASDLEALAVQDPTLIDPSQWTPTS